MDIERIETVIFVANRGNERFEIVMPSTHEGVYVNRYVDRVSTHDYLQPDVPTCMRQAQDEWEVAPSDWRAIEPGSSGGP